MAVRRAALVEQRRRTGSSAPTSTAGASACWSTSTGGDAATGKDIAMHVAASQPLAVGRRRSAGQSTLDKEKRDPASPRSPTAASPPEIQEKMITGRMNEVPQRGHAARPALRKGPRPDRASSTSTARARASPPSCASAVGEGLEKRTENFAEEVMAQVQGAPDGPRDEPRRHERDRPTTGLPRAIDGSCSS